MIYIFQGCGAVLKAPCMCCKAVGQAFDGMCKGCGKACDNCTRSISECWAPIVQNPLGSYVIGTWLMMALVIAACAATVPDASKLKCDELMIFCLADIGIAVIHSTFAFYIQRRLVGAIGKTGKDSMTHAEITQEAKNLAKYDIGFCLYVFFFIAAFAYNVYGVGDGGKCGSTGYQKGAVGLLLFYGVVAWNYAMCWFCGQCCFAKSEKRGIVRTAGGGVASTEPAPLAPSAPAGP
mmetsp:Transcript_16722/g.34033  ORF Transcript_16722/g.34033 Transcript_16722/m.34033 type:complete len:236 (-) Transcript_16722:219-926(-)